MTIIAIVVLVAILGLVIAVITRPLSNQKSQPVLGSNESTDTLRAAYQLVLNRIRELDQDHLEAKISDEDYQSRREALNQDAASFLEQLDELQHAN
jgi:uncharacterized membrane protein